MGWRDDPIIENKQARSRWMNDPVIEPENIGEVGDIPEEMQPVGIAEDVARAIPGHLRKGVEGVIGLPGDIASGVEWVGKKLNEALGASPKEAQMRARAVTAPSSPVLAAPYLASLLWGGKGPLTSEVVNRRGNETFGKPYEPQTTPGEYAATISEFIPGAIAGGGGGTTKEILKNALKFGVAPGAVSETAGQITKDSAKEPYARLAGALIGGGSATLQGGNRPAIKQAIIDASKRLNVPVTKAVGGGVEPSYVAAKLREVPFAGLPLQKATAATTEQLGERARDVSARLGTGAKESSGGVGKEALLGFTNTRAPAIQDRLYNSVDRLVNPNRRRPLTSTLGVVHDIMREQAASTSTASNAALRLVEDAVTHPNGLTYAGLKQLRTDIGARLSGKITPEPGTSQPALKRLYSALTEDLKDTIAYAGGPRATEAFNRANDAAKRINEHRKTIEKVVGKVGDATPNAVFERIVSLGTKSSRGDTTKLREVKRIVGSSAWDEVVSSIVHDIGRGKGDTFSPERFVTAFERFSPQARDVIFGKHAQTLEDIATISRRTEQFNRKGNPSGTGGVTGIVGAILAPIKALAKVAGALTMSRWFASPVRSKQILEWAKMRDAISKNKGAFTRASIINVTRELSKNIAEDTGKDPNDIEKELMTGF